jgi:hypothetical protein
VKDDSTTSSKKREKSKDKKPSNVHKIKTSDTLFSDLPDEDIEWMSDITEDAVQRRKEEALGSSLLADMVQK